MIRNEEDVWKFCKWMYKNEGKEIDIYFRFHILNNIIESYSILKGDLILNRIGTKQQIQMMWNYLDKQYQIATNRK